MEVGQKVTHTLCKNEGHDSWWAHSIYGHFHTSRCLCQACCCPWQLFPCYFHWAADFLFLSNGMLSSSCKFSSASLFTLCWLCNHLARVWAEIKKQNQKTSVLVETLSEFCLRRKLARRGTATLSSLSHSVLCTRGLVFASWTFHRANYHLSEAL